MSETLAAIARSQLSFNADTPGAERTAACKAFLKETMTKLRLRHDQGAPGLEVEHGRTEIIDTIIMRLMAGGVFLSEGILKFVYANQGVGRFTKIGIPLPELRRPVEIIGRFMEIARVRERLLLHDVRSG